MQLDIDVVAGVIADAIKAATGPLEARIAVLEARPVEKGEKGDPGEPGIGQVGPVGPAGAPGRDGADAPPVDLDAIVAKAMALIPVPKDGRDGIDGKDGAPGRDADPVDVDAFVAKAVALIPVPKDGRDGLDGKDGKDGIGIPGRDGLPGVPGLTGEKGADGLNGKDGKDGLGFDDIEEELEDDGRVFVRRYRCVDGRVKEFRHQTAWLIYRDVYRPGQVYVRGDVVTWGNQSWVCRETTSTKPGEGSAWRLMVRKGGDGKTGPTGPVGPQGPRGEQGPLAKVY